MFEEFTLTHPGEQTGELPEILRVGHFRRGSVEIPILLPIGRLNGICFEIDSKTSNQAVWQMQYIALDLLKQVTPDLLRLTFVDMGLNTKFPLLHSFHSPSVHFANTKDELQNEIKRLFETAKYISTKCLNTEFPDLEAYNSVATYKEPYNFLFLTNFPKDCSEQDIVAINKLISEGAMCGIRVIMTIDRSFFPNTRFYNQSYIDVLNEMLREIICLDCTRQYCKMVNMEIPILQRWFSRYTFKFDSYAQSDIKTLTKHLGQTVETEKNDFSNFLSFPIGQYGRDRINFEMGQKSGVYHGLVAGQSGSGKSTLLNNIITNIAQYYSPDDMRLYLLDYKLGVEFKIYKDHPNVEFLMLDNERLSSAIEALTRLQKEMKKREALFDVDLTIQDIDAYNKKAKEKLPRILIIIDEVQQLFKDYETQRQITPLIKYIAKQGRSFGIHMLFSSQSYDGCNISSDILAQMPLRIAFTLASGQECRAILSGDNDVPKTLPHYSAVYNTKNGVKEANVIVKMDNFGRDQILPILQKAAERYPNARPFERTIITRNTELESAVGDGADNTSAKKNINSKWF